MHDWPPCQIVTPGEPWDIVGRWLRGLWGKPAPAAPEPPQRRSTGGPGDIIPIANLPSAYNAAGVANLYAQQMANYQNSGLQQWGGP